ncbi:DEAD-box ATP-dependent RNA helicase 37 [Platanthera guangdongensis]|uniref:DEAD-box ATP-dependent RNA helicase 37 n=1 Tax=Platanthera guangdongensis TaxID=2320717 RepID=A0ABR2MVA7_9ASPA
MNLPCYAHDRSVPLKRFIMCFSQKEYIHVVSNRIRFVDLFAVLPAELVSDHFNTVVLLPIMRSSWADSVANADNSAGAASGSNTTTSSGAGAAASRPARSSYVPPHLRNRPPASDPPSSSQPDVVFATARLSGVSAPSTGSRWGSGGGGGGHPVGRSGFGGGRSVGGGWNPRTGGWDRIRSIPSGMRMKLLMKLSASSRILGSTLMPMKTFLLRLVEIMCRLRAPANTFAEIDLGAALNENIRRCKYVKPTPVQRHAIPISLAGSDLMACAQTGSGKTAAFCFPIISGIMTSPPLQKPR